ncbi:MAG TPA: hypothetical protein VNH83_03195 [Bryobacteraceae bacterium]|nr:hypothetical protein [Bryobacteraceae bacterium]
MRKFTDGSGADSSAAVKALLKSTLTPEIKTLVVIKLAKWLDNVALWVGGGSINPSPYQQTFLLTDCPAAIKYTPLGTFRVAAIKHGAMSFGIGVDFQGFEITWSPAASDIVSPGAGSTWFAVAPDIAALEAVRHGFFDGAFVSVYKVVMPPLGNPPVYDANTYGVTLLNMGCVDQAKVEGGEVTFQVGSIIDQQDQQVPSQLIGPNSRFASKDPMAYAAVSLGSAVNQDAVRWSGLMADRSHATQSASRLVAINAGSPFFSPPTGYFDGGFVVWQFGPLTGMRRPIAHSVTAGGVGGDITFQLAKSFPYDQTIYDSGFAFGFGFDAYALRRTVSTESSGTYDGFPSVPDPVDAF